MRLQSVASLGGDQSKPLGHVCRYSRSANMRKHETCAEGFFHTTMAKAPFIGPLRKCIIEGCDKPARYVTVHLCGKHDMRLRRYGDPHYVTSHEQFRINCRKAALKYKPANENTYKKRHNRHEHRVVAEQMLGRPLMRGEIVHHIDSDKHNNAPENLQVMTRSEHLKVHRAEMEVAKKAKRNATA